MKLDKSIGLVEVKPELWARAFMLGRARQKVNKPIQAAHRDRGTIKNNLGHIQGVFAELLILDLAEKSGNDHIVRHMKQHMFNPDTAADKSTVDLETSLGVGYDVKAMDLAPNKRYIAANSEKHAALEGDCTAYLFVLAPMLGKQAAVARVPYEDVSAWKTKNLGGYNDRARVLNLGVFQALYLPDTDVPELSEATYDKKEIRALIDDDNVRTSFLNEWPNVAPFI